MKDTWLENNYLLILCKYKFYSILETPKHSRAAKRQSHGLLIVNYFLLLLLIIQEKPTNCGTRAADVLTNFLAGQL